MASGGHTPEGMAYSWPRRVRCSPPRAANPGGHPMSHLTPWLGTALVMSVIAGALSPNPEPELGLVRWGHDLDAALATSRESGRPVLALFDEVPGCATCRGFGAEVLSLPLIAEAIESEFVPLFVANCRPGRDAAWLARFGEPAWNNPGVRFLDASGHDVIARADGLYSPHEIAARLGDALRAAGRPVPGYVALAIE